MRENEPAHLPILPQPILADHTMTPDEIVGKLQAHDQALERLTQITTAHGADIAQLKADEAGEIVSTVRRRLWPRLKAALPTMAHLASYAAVAVLASLLTRGCPAPVPPGPPVPPTPPAPIPVKGLRALIVYDSAQLSKLPPAQNIVLYSQSIRDYLGANNWRVFDKGVDATNDAQIWQDALKRPRAALPWIVISNGSAGYEGPLPGTVADTLTLLKKYGG